SPLPTLTRPTAPSITPPSPAPSPPCSTSTTLLLTPAKPARSSFSSPNRASWRHPPSRSTARAASTLAGSAARPLREPHSTVSRPRPKSAPCRTSWRATATPSFPALVLPAPGSDMRSAPRTGSSWSSLRIGTLVLSVFSSPCA
ncbi:hypothetical protein LTR66_000401, partial [Elasticomyces elasticus]